MHDNGPGVPQKARDHLFEAFTGSQRKGGTGLGLAIAAEIVGVHGGHVRLLDTPKGAAFQFDIPDRGVHHGRDEAADDTGGTSRGRPCVGPAKALRGRARAISSGHLRRGVQLAGCLGLCVTAKRRQAPVAQLDRASDYESEGRTFESFRARHSLQHLNVNVASPADSSVSQPSRRALTLDGDRSLQRDG